MISEDRTQSAVATYLRYQYPKAIFNSDLSGIRLTINQARKASGTRSSRAFPDLVIYEKRRGFAGLFIELKKEGTRIFTKKGDLVSDPHVREQHEMMKELTRRGYCARFAVGFNEAKLLIDWYFKSERCEKEQI